MRPVEPGADLGEDMRAKPNAARLASLPCWARGHAPACYLETSTSPSRGAGGDVAHRLIEAVYAFADGFGTASVYWLTQEYNAPARALYDTLAHRTSFVVYRR